MELPASKKSEETITAGGDHLPPETSDPLSPGRSYLNPSDEPGIDELPENDDVTPEEEQSPSHEKRARSADYRMDSAWFGQGAMLKQRALHGALSLVA